MPLYIEDSEILETYPEPIANAMLRIKRQMAEKSVNPRLAARLLKQELNPLIDAEHHDILNELINPTWADIHWTFPAMVFRGGPKGYFLHNIAKCIRAVSERTTHPPRDPVVFEKMEIRQVLEMSKRKGKDISFLRYIGNDAFDVLSSCKYCWRQPMPRRLVCTSHAGGGKFKEINIGTNFSKQKKRSDSALRKEAYRQDKLFKEILLRKISDESSEFDESGFEADVPIPTKDIWGWLKKRREEVAQLLKDEDLPTGDEFIIDSLLKVLHTPTNLGAFYEGPFIRANQAFKNEPQLMWPMLIRADTWLAARNELRDNWGGNRMQVQPKSPQKNWFSFALSKIKAIFKR